MLKAPRLTLDQVRAFLDDAVPLAAESLEKPRTGQFTKSSARRTDDAPVESENGSVARKHPGCGPTPNG